MTVVDLIAEAVAIAELDADVLESTDIGCHAMEYAVRGWPVLPLRGKAPAIANPHPRFSIERRTCKGQCGQNGHGFYDATTDLGTVALWWGQVYRGANIGIRLPESVFVIDVDPRSGGLSTVKAWTTRFGPLPTTHMTVSGRGDGGVHLYFQHPGGPLSGKALRKSGVDLKTHDGLVIAPPSVHPDTGRRYIRSDAPIASPPAWLVSLLRPKSPVSKATCSPVTTGSLAGFWAPDSVADRYAATTPWATILEPHGWVCLDADGDADGARWRRPGTTAASSATVQFGKLFVWSTSTEFEPSDSGDPHGQTKFRAYAVLNHRGDLKAAARALKGAV